MTKHVAVLMGGWSAEREVSLSSGQGVAEALKNAGYKVTLVDVNKNIAEVLAKLKPDVAFNALHGRYGEDGCIQGILEVLDIPYTHSGVRASAMAMDKPTAKKIFAAVGIPTAEGKVVKKEDMLKGAPMERPFVIKPINEGSSVGVTIIHENAPYDFDANNWPFGDEVLVEKYIAGREVQAAVITDSKRGDYALGAIEIRPKSGFYDYAAKYTEGKADHLMPAPIDKKCYEQILEYAVRAHQALGCKGVTRSDFRYDDTKGEPGKIYILETNNQPGMTPLSLTPEIAAHTGMSYQDLVVHLVNEATCESLMVKQSQTERPKAYCND